MNRQKLPGDVNIMPLNRLNAREIDYPNDSVSNIDVIFLFICSFSPCRLLENHKLVNVTSMQIFIQKLSVASVTQLVLTLNYVHTLILEQVPQYIINNRRTGWKCRGSRHGANSASHFFSDIKLQTAHTTRVIVWCEVVKRVDIVYF